ncbi:MAG: hypothetical protein ACRDSF_24755 [Pseudonocardiaceae bacterium]
MSAAHGFEPIAEVTADDRGRLAVGRAGVRGNDRFLVSTRPTGEILLTPVASVPKRELLVWEDDELRASLLRGLADAAQGRVARRDDLLDADDGE